MMAGSAFVVVDIWRVKEGKQAEITGVLAESARMFRSRPGILSVDYTHLDGDPERYLVVFRYTSQHDREAFQQTEELRETMQRLSELWDLESPIWKGHETEL
jgi:heme-degrading monooxygenase HmoA